MMTAKSMLSKRPSQMLHVMVKLQCNIFKLKCFHSFVLYFFDNNRLCAAVLHKLLAGLHKKFFNEEL